MLSLRLSFVTKWALLFIAENAAACNEWIFFEKNVLSKIEKIYFYDCIFFLSKSFSYTIDFNFIKWNAITRD